MKKTTILAIIMMTLSVLVYGQNDNYIVNAEHEIQKRFVLYNSEHLFTFLKLDTRTGKIWKIYSDTSAERVKQEAINTKELAPADGSENGRFSLHKTGNMYICILMDNTDGRVWHIEWGSRNNRNRITEIK